MSTPRKYLAATTLNGFIYAIGGSDGSSYLNTAERYDPQADSWTSIAAMGTQRSYLATTTLLAPRPPASIPKEHVF